MTIQPYSSGHQPVLQDHFSEERSHYAAMAYERAALASRVRRDLQPLADRAHRLASLLDGEERRQAEDLREALARLIQRAS